MFKTPVIQQSIPKFHAFGVEKRHHYFRGIADHLRTQGAAVHTSRVSPLGTVPERAEALANFVRDLDSKRVVVVGHSMGGLDGRYALSKLGLAEQVSSMITIATPHRGTYLAEAAELLPARALRKLLGRAGVKSDALSWLGEVVSKEFNEEIVDARGVLYGCVVGQTTRTRVLANPLLLACYELLLRMRGENDGLVPASSQRWGRELMVVPAHHFGQIGWSPLFDANKMFLDVLHQLDASGIACLPASRAAQSTRTIPRTQNQRSAM